MTLRGVPARGGSQGVGPTLGLHCAKVRRSGSMSWSSLLSPFFSSRWHLSGKRPSMVTQGWRIMSVSRMRSRGFCTEEGAAGVTHHVGEQDALTRVLHGGGVGAAGVGAVLGIWVMCRQKKEE